VTALPRTHLERLQHHTEEINRRLGFSFTLADFVNANMNYDRLGDAATETLVSNAAGLMRLLKIPAKSLQPFLLSSPTFFRRSPFSVQTQFTDIAALLGMPWRSYVKKVLKAHRIANATPESVNILIDALATELELSPAAVKAILKRHTILLGSNANTLVSNIRTTIDRLNLSKSDYATFVRRAPGLLATPTDTLETKVKTFADIFSIHPATALKALRRSPPLLAMATDTIRNNLHRTATALNIPVHNWSQTVIKKPSLASYRAGTLLSTVSQIASLFKMSAPDVIAIASRFPSLLCISIEAYESKLPLVLKFCRTLGFDYTPAETLRECPLAFTYAPRRLQERLRLAELGLGPRSIMNLLTLANEDAAPLLRRSRLHP